VTTLTEITQRMLDDSMSRPAVTRCAWCDWTFEGTLRDGTAAHRTHRRAAHGWRPSRRRKRARNAVMLPGRIDENVAAVRAQGGARWKT